VRPGIEYRRCNHAGVDVLEVVGRLVCVLGDGGSLEQRRVVDEKGEEEIREEGRGGERKRRGTEQSRREETRPPVWIYRERERERDTYRCRHTP
jgi:hypothetical protein